VTKVIMESLKGKLRLFYLPPYSRDLNPDDLAWNHLKNHTAGRMAMTDKREFKCRVSGLMRALEKQPPKACILLSEG
jgi:hypothetical protein